MSKYRVSVVDRGTLLAAFESYEEARDRAIEVAKSTGKETCVMELKSTHSPVISSYEEATDYLGDDAKNHRNAMCALGALIVLAEAWNKQDGFVPDISNRNQYKHSPGFMYNDKAAGFVYAPASTMLCTYTTAGIGSRLCFKTEKRAAQFGKQFIDLWNDFLLYR